jgi:hypothetical protein
MHLSWEIACEAALVPGRVRGGMGSFETSAAEPAMIPNCKG